MYNKVLIFVQYFCTFVLIGKSIRIGAITNDIESNTTKYH